MVRKIGFGQSLEKSKSSSQPSVADRYVEEFRAKSRRQTPEKPPAPKTPLAGRIAVSIFLLVWLTGWSAGIIAVAVILVSNGFSFFLVFWEFFAIIGWFFAAAALKRTIKGQPLKVNGRR